MAKIKISNGMTINAPDGLAPEQYDEIVNDAVSRFDMSTPTVAPSPVEAPDTQDFFSRKPRIQLPDTFTPRKFEGSKIVSQVGNTLKGAASSIGEGALALGDLGERAVNFGLPPQLDLQLFKKLKGSLTPKLQQYHQEAVDDSTKNAFMPINQSFLPDAEIKPEQIPALLGKILPKEFVSGALNKTYSAAQGLFNPENLALLGGGAALSKAGAAAQIAEKAIASTFLPGLGESTIQGAKNIVEGYNTGDNELTGEGLAELLTSGAFTAGVARNVIGKGIPAGTKTEMRGTTVEPPVGGSAPAPGIPQEFKPPVRGTFPLDQPKPEAASISPEQINKILTDFKIKENLQKTAEMNAESPLIIKDTPAPQGIPTNLVTPQGLDISKITGREFVVGGNSPQLPLIPESFGGKPRTIQEQLAIEAAATPPAPKALPALTQAPRLETLPQGSVALMGEGGKVSGVQMPSENFGGVMPKNVKQMSTLELLKTLVTDETGSVGKMSERTKLSREAGTELSRRASKYAEENGISIDEATRLILQNPKVLDSKSRDGGLILPQEFKSAQPSKVTTQGVPELKAEFKPVAPPKTVGESVATAKATPVDANFEAFKKSIEKMKSSSEFIDGTVTDKNKVAWEKSKAALEDFKNEHEMFLGKELPKAILDTKLEKLWTEARKSLELPVAGQKSTAMKKWQNTTNVASRIQKATGIPAGQHALKLIEADYLASHKLKALTEIGKQKDIQKTLTRQGLNGKQVYDLMQYVQSVDGKASWNPEALVVKRGNKIVDNIPAYEGKTPSPKAMKALFELRQVYDEFYKNAKTLGDKVGYHNRYVPRMDKVPFTEIGSSLFGETSSIFDPRILKKRSGRDVPLETDFWRVHKRYINTLAKAEVYPEIIRSGREIDTQLKLAGYNNEAAYMEKALQDALGMKDPKSMQKYHAEDIARMSAEQIEKFLTDEGLAPSKADKFLREVEQQAYHAWMGLNPRNLIAQFFQMELGGSSDLGVKGISRALAYKYSGKPMWSTADKAALQEVSTRLGAADYNPLAMPNETRVDTGKSMLSKVLKAPGVPGLKLMHIFDDYSKKTIFLAARDTFMNSKSPKEKLKNFTEAERQNVLDAMKTGGKELAAKEYGVMMAQRIIHRMSFAERPEGMRDGIGKHIPFTSFSRGEVNKIYEDWSNGNKSALGKRLIYPLILAAMLGGDDSDDVLYFHPAVSSLGLANMGVTPALGSIAEGFQRGSTLPKKFNAAFKAAAKTTATGRVATKLAE